MAADRTVQAPPGAPEPTTALPAVPGEVWRIAIVIVLGGFMAQLDSSLVNVGIATISRQLSASLDTTQWISSGYLLALAAGLPVCGWLSRRAGTGRLWLGALAAFTLLSGLCACAPDIAVLIVLRIAQGVAGGLLVPAGQTVIGQAAGPQRMGRVMSTVGIAVVIGPALGPALGGLLIAHLSWRWLFLVNLPIGAVALLLGRRMIPRGDRQSGQRFDVGGFVLIAFGLPALTYGLSQAGHAGAATVSIAVPTALGAVALIIFGWRSLRQRRPLLDLRLFANRVFGAAACLCLFSGAALFGGLIILPLYFQILRGDGVIGTGVAMMAFGIGSAVMMPLSGRLTDRIGGGIASIVGLTVSALAIAPFVFLGAAASMILIEALLALLGVGIALAVMPAVITAYATVAREQLPDATAQINIVQRLGGAIGGALFVALLGTATGAPAKLGAFHTAFAWLTGATVLALAAAVWLAAARGKQDWVTRAR
jgi:EmrB/QacA subfamily drug resistance transporter